MKQAKICHLFDECHEVMTVREVALAVRCSESHLLDLIHRDELPCFRIGRGYRVLKSDVVGCLGRVQ